LTFSTISISPPDGQFAPTVQNAGQVVQPVGMCLTARLRSWPLTKGSLEVIRTLSRFAPGAVQDLASTLRMTLPLET
jgi:hypothetical protein